MYKNFMGRKKIHGMSNSRIYMTWLQMKKRCLNPKSTRYSRYGGRGIKVCDSWKNSFMNFFRDMGHPPTQIHSLDRINNDGEYCKENCRWATPAEQNRNMKTNILIEFNGSSIILKDYCKIKNIPYSRTVGRLGSGMPIHEALNKPNLKKSPIEWQGKIYERKELAKHLNLNVKTLNYRIKKGLKLDAPLRKKIK